MGRRLHSIHLRLLVANLLILPVFLGLTGYGLDGAFGQYQRDSQQENMRLQQLLLAKAAEWDGASWVVQGLDEPRLGLPDSGLYAFVFSPDGSLQWQSDSAAQSEGAQTRGPVLASLLQESSVLGMALGEQRFFDCHMQVAWFCHAAAIAWGSSGPVGLFLIMEDQAPLLAARADYRNYLLLLCLVLAGLLLLAQLGILRWGLGPLRRITDDVDGLKRGELQRLGDDVPVELAPLTGNINVLLDSEQRRRERVRNTVDRLTHTLKTPLMLLRNSEAQGSDYRELVDEQVGRILGIVEGELARARLDGKAPDILHQAVPVKPILERIARAYQRLPRLDAPTAGPVDVDTRGIADNISFLGEERDLQDLFGSVLENAIRYCRSQVLVYASIDNDGVDSWLVLQVDDDGEGIPGGQEREVLQRGARADTVSDGQGLGLSIALEIVSAYGGSLRAGRSSLGGACIEIRLPGSGTANAHGAP